MDDVRLRRECEALKDRGASAEEIFRYMKDRGCKNWQGQIMLMGLFDLPMDDARRISHRVCGLDHSSEMP